MQLPKFGITKFTAFIIALQVLNMSIDSPNATQDNSTTTDNFNYIDTYVEYVAEIVMKYDNAIPEAGKRQQKQMPHKTYQVICEQVKETANNFALYWREQKIFFDYCDQYTYQFIKEISPPPKFSS